MWVGGWVGGWVCVGVLPQAALVTCEGLQRTPIPLIYTHHTERFLGLWTLLLPLALVQAGSVID